MRPPAGEYLIATSSRLTSEQAAEHIFPDDALVVCVNTYPHGRHVTYRYLIDYPEARHEPPT